MLFISTLYNMPNYLSQKSKIYGQMSREEFTHVPGKWYFLCLLVEGMILSTFFTCPVLKRVILKSRELLYVIQKGVRNNNNQRFLGWENSSLP